MTPEVKDMLVGWLRHADKSTNPFESFIFTWIAFNGWGERVAQPRSRDSEWVAALACCEVIRGDFKNAIVQDPKLGAATEEFAGWWPILRAQEQRGQNRPEFDRPRTAVVRYWLDRGVHCSPDCAHPDDYPIDWPHTVWALYQVRHNLFHGEKSMSSDADREIVGAATLVLGGFLRQTRYVDQ